MLANENQYLKPKTMKPNPDQVEDQLLDALLHEQNRSDREQALADIEAALHGGSRPFQVKARPVWPRRLGIIAASVALGGMTMLWMNRNGKGDRLLATNEVHKSNEQNQVSESAAVDADRIVAYREKVNPDGDGSSIIVASRDSILFSSTSKVNLDADGDGLSGGEDTWLNTERYGSLIDSTWQRPTEAPLSTFSIDVDTASYSNIRRMIREGQAIPADAVRIEECVNAFKYRYESPTDGKAFAVQTELATCPWNESNLLVKFGIKGREIASEKRPVSNLVFLIDVSGSMQASNKLPLVKESLKLLLHQLDERDSVSFVVYAGSEGVVLPPTKMTESGRVQALQSLEKLEAGGSTNGGAGITRAYQLAMENFIKGGVNRVILASDGDFNVGVTGQDALVSLVKERAAKNVYLSALAFGTGNLNDSMFEAISKDGNGNYFYIDGIREARKVLLENLTGSLITIAKDVKIQVEFNPRKVGSYRLIGYANRTLKDKDFNNDKVDAGDIGAGHTVTAFYEIVPAGMPLPNAGGVDPLKYQKDEAREKAPAAEPSDEWLTLKLRHKHPEGDISALEESVVRGGATPWRESGSDFQFAAAVAIFGMKLREMGEVSQYPWDSVRQLASPGLRDDQNKDRAEFLELIGELEKQSR
jgi:Ca-activated chloride channel family protein